MNSRSMKFASAVADFINSLGLRDVDAKVELTPTYDTGETTALKTFVVPTGRKLERASLDGETETLRADVVVQRFVGSPCDVDAFDETARIVEAIQTALKAATLDADGTLYAVVEADCDEIFVPQHLVAASTFTGVIYVDAETSYIYGD